MLIRDLRHYFDSLSRRSRGFLTQWSKMQIFYSSVQWTSSSHLPHLDVGGTAFGQDYIPVVRQLIGRGNRAFEFCAGPGFIGFSLLAHGLCRSLCLSDTNPEAVAVARETIKRNGLENRVSVYESDALDQIPPSEKWDLVLSDLPHFADQFAGSIRRFDPSWSIHRKFYASLKPHMNPGCTVLVQENYEGSNESDFTDMIRAGGLRYDGSFMYADPQRRKCLDTYYFMLSKRAEDPHAIIWPSRDIIHGATSIVAAPLCENDTRTIKVSADRRYRLLFENNMRRDVNLLVFRRRLGLQRFLRSFGTIPSGAHLSFAFHCYAGQYAFRDASTGKTMLRVTARSAPNSTYN